MFEINNNKIKITKGDVATIYVDLVDADGNEIEMDGTLTLTVRNKIDGDVLLTTSSNTNMIYLLTEKTKALKLGWNYYDIQYLDSEGNEVTITNPESKSKPNFYVMPEVTE